MESSSVPVSTRAWPRPGQVSMDLTQALQAAGVTTAIVAGTDTHGLLRGKRVPVSRLADVLEHGIALCEAVWALGFDERRPVERPAGAGGWFPGDGYPDVRAIPDPATLRAPARGSETAVVLCDFATSDRRRLPTCPRGILGDVVQRVLELGYEPLIGIELECYVLDETAASVTAKRPLMLTAVEPEPRAYDVSGAGALAAFARRLSQRLAELEVGLEAWHVEAGPGQLELTLAPVPAVQAADTAVLLKHLAKEVAFDLGAVATFMSKPRSDWPGSGCHLHLSLWSDGQAAFHDPDAPHGISEIMAGFGAGLLEHMAELTAIMVPTPNGYRRLVPYSWAPTSATWAVDNRSVAVRAVCDGPEGSRIEYRQPGAEANPYLVAAAVLAAGVDGIECGRRLPAEARGDRYALTTDPPDAADSALPRTLGDATEQLHGSALARDWLGPEFVEHFVAMTRAELAEQAIAVTDWETGRYLVAM